jgi:hypothetical protein
LDNEVKLELMKPYLMDPFNLPENPKLINPISLELFGNWENGTYLLNNPFNLNFSRKVIVNENKVIKAYLLNSETGRFNLIRQNENNRS